MFSLSATPLDREELTRSLSNLGAGAIVAFEGWVRNHNQGKQVLSLEYQVYEELAVKEGGRILEEARTKFNLRGASAVHRHGHLQLGEIAVWIGATAAHRDDAFKATRYIIDEIKHRLPVWKKEHYVDEAPEWVFCRHHHHHVHFEEAEYYKKQALLVSQEKLKAARVLVIGAGGLGCPALLGLAQAGVGTITVVDFDRVDISNIHRQSLFAPNLVGETKAEVARARLSELNPFINVRSLNVRVDEENVLPLIRNQDLVLDCTDNMQTKYLLHDACFKERIPFITAGVYRHEAQLRTFLPGGTHGCLRCQVGETPRDALLGNCNDFGVLGVTTSIIGSLEASEAIQLLTQGSNATAAHSLFVNLQDLTQMRIKSSARPGCRTCQGEIEIEGGKLEVDADFLGEAVAFLDIRELKDEDVLTYSPSDRPVVLCCHRGVRSKRLVEELRGQGHEHFYSLKGGACSL